ncbi:hypothetical protein SAMD00079811_38580 [Scytonema sp. HK-05]|jgi:hypothetical protein|uniref:DUF6679 family protein n=1 Tax=Scytonema sp. HK-05 TaxID=1137095 RepID=UPI0009367832|nr:DUF6679 family protein [Scytonema sp. HK-05]OKH59283.1 hypothetical protein NIES2130_09300 [Scytonema sp. HK-05]BAY46250.1 hypothetical protein SAMD00079811_38580 [Scytonema sp. HK-05]
MESKLKELIGQPNVWLFVKSSNGWLKNVEILDVNLDTVTFRYEHESEAENRVWEKTTRIDNIAEIEVRLLTLPRGDKQVQEIKNRLSKLLEQEER